MAEAFAWLRRRLANRPDSEHGQALVRIVLILLILGYVLLPSSRAGLDPEQYRTDGGRLNLLRVRAALAERKTT